MIKKLFFFLFIIGACSCGTKPPTEVSTSEVSAPPPGAQKKTYRASYTKHVDLAHTRLNVSFDWKKKQLIGQAAIILRPHFYPIDTLSLNARSMDLREVALLSSYGKHLPLKYTYDSLRINIQLDRTYSKDESFTLFISYVAKPEEVTTTGSAAIRGDKGLYFIDADSLDPDKPTQVWTQGETESNSCWFPTVEDPAQKMTQEIYISVDTAFTTLSNGLLISSVDNGDGTKTDYWKQSLPAAPYLAMMAIGKFSIVKDSWKNIEVNYYVDPPYEKYANVIFGNTPEMIDYFSNLLGIPYPWEKYSQVVVHNYISGAMENTTAVVHGTTIQQTPREHADANYEDYISHELFHHWFGDLVTCESWSNVTLNEGFANYSQYLWREYKFGREDADRLNQSDLAIYLATTENDDPPVFRYEYKDKDDVYDAVSYHKSGRILHMLRKYVGDAAFFAALHSYLTEYMFSSAEVTNLRLVFENITGEDLNWFFDQWYFRPGHPVIQIDYEWSDSSRQQTVIITQNQNLEDNPLYKLPLEVDIYHSGKKERKKIVVEDREQKFYFDLPVKPDLVNVDAEKSLLCIKKDNKSNNELIFQYEHAPLFLDRFEAVSKIGSKYSVNTPEAELIMKALHDRFYVIRVTAINNIGELAMNDTVRTRNELRLLATTDSSADVRERALLALGKYYRYSELSPVYLNALNDSSYKVATRAFKIVAEKDWTKANEAAAIMEKDSNNTFLAALAEFYVESTDDKTGFYSRALKYSSRRYQIAKDFGRYLKNSSSEQVLTKGVSILYEKAKTSSSNNFKAYIAGILRELESMLKKKINDSEDSLNKSNDQDTEKQAELQEWRILRNNLKDKISTIDK